MISLDDRRARDVIAVVREHLSSNSAVLHSDLRLIDQLDAAASPRLKAELDGLRAQVSLKLAGIDHGDHANFDQGSQQMAAYPDLERHATRAPEEHHS